MIQLHITNNGATSELGGHNQLEADDLVDPKESGAMRFGTEARHGEG